MNNRRLNQIIGQKIAIQRQKAGMTQEAVAEALNVGNEAISRLERGTVAASVPRLMELAELFNCQTGVFFLEQSKLVQDQVAEIQVLLSRVNSENRKFALEQLRHTVSWLEKQEKKQP